MIVWAQVGDRAAFGLAVEADHRAVRQDVENAPQRLDGGWRGALDQRLQRNRVEKPLAEQHFDHGRYEQAMSGIELLQVAPPIEGEAGGADNCRPGGEGHQDVAEPTDVMQW